MYTVFGATGFIGGQIVDYLRLNNIPCFTPERSYFLDNKTNLGNVIYCIGLTADFRYRQMDTVESHVCKLKNILETIKFDSFLYLSSTRVYNGLEDAIEENSLKVNPLNFSDLYNISKLMGESICLNHPNNNVRVARLSNVIGSDFNSENFVISLIKDSLNKGFIELNSPTNIGKDYIYIEDVVKLLLEIAAGSNERIYNVASGKMTYTEDIVKIIQNITNCKVSYKAVGDLLLFPIMNIERIQKEFNFQPSNILDKIPILINQYKKLKNDPV